MREEGTGNWEPSLGLPRALFLVLARRINLFPHFQQAISALKSHGITDRWVLYFMIKAPVSKERRAICFVDKNNILASTL